MLPKKKTQVRKEEIIQASLAVIGERGVGGTTIAAIAEKAGMSEANIYRHFSGKREIFIALTEFIGNNIMKKAATIAAGSGSPLAKLQKIYTFHLALIAQNPGMPRFIFSEDIHIGDRELAQSLFLRMSGYVETLAGIIAAGVAEGEFTAGTAPRETALTLLGMMSFTALRWNMSNAAFDIREEGERLLHNFLQLLRGTNADTM